MISQEDRKRLQEAERKCDWQLARIRTYFEKSAKYLGTFGIVLALYYSFSYREVIGLGTFMVIGLFPLLLAAIVTLVMTGIACRRYLRICEAILGPYDDDPDPDDEEDIPKEPPKEISCVGDNIVSFPIKKAA